MLKWIKNSSGTRANKTSNYRGIRFLEKKYKSTLTLSRYTREGKRVQTTYMIGSYNTEKEAVKARVNFIIDLL